MQNLLFILAICLLTHQLVQGLNLSDDGKYNKIDRESKVSLYGEQRLPLKVGSDKSRKLDSACKTTSSNGFCEECESNLYFLVGRECKSCSDLLENCLKCSIIGCEECYGDYTLTTDLNMIKSEIICTKNSRKCDRTITYINSERKSMNLCVVEYNFFYSFSEDFLSATFTIVSLAIGIPCFIIYVVMIIVCIVKICRRENQIRGSRPLDREQLKKKHITCSICGKRRRRSSNSKKLLKEVGNLNGNNNIEENQNRNDYEIIPNNSPLQQPENTAANRSPEVNAQLNLNQDSAEILPCQGFLCYLCVKVAEENLKTGVYPKCVHCNERVIWFYDADAERVAEESVNQPEEVLNSSINRDDQDKCIVCFKRNIDSVIPCANKPRHKLHRECLMRFLKDSRHGGCPICRTNLFE